MSAGLSGAVDLSALKARAEAANQPPPPAGTAGPAATVPQAPSGPASQFVVDVTEAAFQSVIEQSMQAPIVLALWSPRSPQSVELLQTLEDLAVESAGTWLLGRIDADAQPRIAQALQVEAVPSVRAVLQGQVVAEFTGVQGDAELRAFLKSLVEAAGGTLPEGAGPPEDPRVDEAEAAVADGDLDRAVTLYESLLSDQPAHAFAADALRQVKLMQRVGDSGADDSAAAVAAADAAPDDVELQCTAADLEVAEGRYDSAFARLLHVVRTGEDDPKDRARARLIELFAVVGDTDPAVGKARRELASVLF